MFSCEYVFLAIPPSALENLLRSALPHLSKHTVLIDCSSVKEYPKKIFKAILPQEQACILTHPLFGPGSYAAQGNTLRGSSISMEVLHSSAEQEAKLKNLFLALELAVHEVSSEDHDRITARTQFVSLCIARLVKELGIGENLLDTPSSRSLVEFAKRVSVDESLLREILRYNQFAQGELRRIEMYFEGLQQSIQKDN
jgi:arogenate dehydrogenase (NADP+)